MIVTDKMPFTMNPCDGQYYDSKSEYHRVTVAHDCYEVGDNVDLEAAARRKAQLGRKADLITDAEIDLQLQTIYDSCDEVESVSPFSPCEELRPHFMV